MDRKAFLDQQPPPGYVAGIGRGATGFTTGADTGAVDIDAENADISDDELHFGGLRSKDDDEADKIYAGIEKRLQRGKEEVHDESTSILDPIKDQFADLKRGLAAVTTEQWEGLTSAGDLTRRNKRLRILEKLQQRTYAAPDSLIAGTETNFQLISAARDRLLGSQLDQLTKGANGSQNGSLDSDDLGLATIDTTLPSAPVGDVKKARLVLSSLRKAEPRKASSWIASARLEEQARSMLAAKALIAEGCLKVPRNEDVWLENIRLNPETKIAKGIVGDALRANSESEKLWLAARDLEHPSDSVSRTKVMKKALEYLPHSHTIWTALIDLEDDKLDAKKLLSKATELCPDHWPFYLLLLELSDHIEAKTVLNSARKTIKDHRVWVAAVKLEEREVHDVETAKLAKMLSKGLKELEKSGSNTLSRHEWLEQAAEAEKEGFLKAATAIVNTSLDHSADEASMEDWILEAEHFSAKKNHHTANAIYEFVTDKKPHNVECWTRLLSSLKASQVGLSQLFKYYEKAVQLNGSNELLALMYAKDKWILEDDIAGAREILNKAQETLPTNENVWLARIKLEVKTRHYDIARKLSSASVKTTSDPSPRLWYKHIHLMRFLNKLDPQKLLEICEDALGRFPECPQLHLQKSQILLSMESVQEAREALSFAVKKCPSSVALWCALVGVDEKQLKSLIRARSTIDTAISQNPNNDVLFEHKIILERRHGDIVATRQLVSKALKLFPNSPLIWIQHLALIPKMSHRKNAFVDALKATGNSPMLLLDIGVHFWADGKPPKAKAWFQRSIDADSTNGEAWAWMLVFTEKYESAEEKESLLKRFEEHYEDINSGYEWNRIHKDVANFEKSPKEVLRLVAENVLANK